MKNITIVGCGSVGFIHAYYFSQLGYEISFLKTSDFNSIYYEKVKSDGFFEVSDMGEEKKRVSYKLITRDPEQVIPSADIVLIATTTLQHELISEKIAHLLKDDQVVCIIPSYASSLLFKKLTGNKRIKYVEFETTLFNGRIIDENYININFKNIRIAAYFDGFTENEKLLFKKNVIDVDKEAKNTFEIAFHNPNMIVHTLGVLLSASRIEFSQGNFWMYKEAFTPSVIKVIQSFDAEKNKILKVMGCDELTYFDAAKWRNEKDLKQDSLAVFRSFAKDSNKGPNQLRHRYLLEDVPMGLCLFQSVGQTLGIDTKIADAIIILASALLDEDFVLQGRSLNKLLDSKNVSKDDFLNTLSNL